MSERARSRVIAAVVVLAVVGMGLGFAAAAMPADDPDRTAEIPELEMADDDDDDLQTDLSDLESSWAGADVDDSLLDETGETVVILDVERGIDTDAAAATGDATPLLKADSEATLEPVAEEVATLEAATVRHDIWVGNLLTVEIDLDTHDVEELARIDGVERVLPNIEFERPDAPDSTVEPDETYDLAVVGSTIQEDSTFGMDFVRIFLDERLDDSTFNVHGVHPDPDDDDPGDAPINETMDQYDAFVVNTMGGLDSDAIMESFLDNLAGEPVVYLDQYQNADAIEDLSDVREDPGEVSEEFDEDEEVQFMELEVTAEHPVYTGLGTEVGERIPLFDIGDDGFLDRVVFDQYSGEEIGDIGPDNDAPFGHAAAVDDDRNEMLLGIGQGGLVDWNDQGEYTYTESAEILLTNAVEYTVTGNVTPPDEDPVDMDVTYGLEQIDIPGFEDAFDGERGANATVSIVDTGLSDPDEGHPDLDIAQKFLIQGGEVTEGIVEVGAHGEHVAGTAAGAADPVGEVPRFGVAPEAELIKIDVFGDDPGAAFEDVALGIELSANEGADAGGFSLGAANPDFPESTFEPTFTGTVEDANAAGMVVSVSSGNEGTGPVGGQVTSPGTQFDSFTVGASTEDGGIATFSSGAVIRDDTVLTVGGDPVDLPEHFPREYVKPDVTAAGQDVLSAGPLGGDIGDPAASYSFSDGTSMAQPHVAGAAALLQSVTDEQLAPKQIESALAETAEKPDDAPGPANQRDIRYGTGIINVTAAALALEDAQTVSGAVTSSATGDGIVGATIESADGALTTARDAGAYTIHPTSNPAELTADAFGFAPETVEVGGAESDGATVDRGVSASGIDNHTVVDFAWPAECPDEDVADLDTYFDGDISESDDHFHLDNADGADDEPPAAGCVLRTEGENASIHSTPGDQTDDIDYYPQRGDTLSWNHYAHHLSSVYAGADFEFRFGLQDESNYYFLTTEADETPYELVVGEMSDGSVVTEDRTSINDTLVAETFQPVEIDWGDSTIEATFDGTETVSIDSTSLDDGGIGFARQGTQGSVQSYTHLVDAVVADTAAHVGIADVDHPGSIAPDEDLTVEYTLENEGYQTVTESEIGLVVGSEQVDADTDVALEPGETTTGELTYESSGEYDEGDSLDIAVELGEWNDAEDDEVHVGDQSEVDYDFELDPTVDAELVQDQPAFVVAGDSFDIVVDVANLEAITVELAGDADVAPEDLTVLLGEDELPLGEEVELEEPVTGEVALTVETDADIEDGSMFGLAHTLSGEGDQLTLETGPTEVVDDVPPAAFEVTDFAVQETVTTDELIQIVAEIENVGGQTGETEALTGVEGPTVDGEETLVFFPPDPIELDPGESIVLPTDFGTVEDINEVIDSVEWGPGDELTAVQQVGENLDPTEDPEPEIEDQASQEFLVVEDDIEGPFFQVGDLDAPAEADPGETIDVSATITNIGNEAGTQDIEYVFDETVEDTESDVSLDPDESTTVTFTDFELPTEEDIYEHGVFSDDDSATADITVGDVEPSEFELSNLDQPDELAIDDPIVGEIEVTNVGGAAGEAEVLYATDIDGNFIFIPDEIETVDLEPGESTTIEESLLTFEDINDQLGTEYGPGDDVLTGFQVGQNLDPNEDPEPEIDDEFAQTITIIGEPFFEVTDFDAPRQAEPGDQIDVSATVTNLGEVTTQDVVYEFDGEQADIEPGLELGPGDSVTVEFDNVTLPEESGAYAHGVFTDDDSATAAIGVGIELATVTVVANDDDVDFGQQTADLLTRGVDFTEDPFAVDVLDSTAVDEEVIEDTDAFVFHDFADGVAAEVIPAVEDDNDTHAVYLEQFADANALSDRIDVLDDPDAAIAEFDFGEALPVSFDIQAEHPLFEGVGEPGDSVLVHQEEDSDRVFFEGADGDTLAEVGIEGEEADGPVATVDPDSEAVLLGTIAPHTFQQEPAFTDEAAAILGNAVTLGLETEPPEVELSNLSIAGQGDSATIIEGGQDVTVEMTHVGGGAGTVEVTKTIGDKVDTVAVDLAVEETVTVTFENATEDLTPDQYTVEVSAGDDVVMTGNLLVSVDVLGDGNPATDTTGDGLLNDVDGDGEFTIFDVQAFFNHFNDDAVQNNPHLFNFQDNEGIGIFDVQVLFNQLAAEG